MGTAEWIILFLILAVFAAIITTIIKLYNKSKFIKWVAFVLSFILSFFVSPLIALITGSDAKNTAYISSFSFGYFPMLSILYLSPKWKVFFRNSYMILLTIPIVLIPFFSSEINQLSVSMNILIFAGGALGILTYWLKSKSYSKYSNIKSKSNVERDILNTIHVAIDGLLISKDDEIIKLSENHVSNNLKQILLEINSNNQTKNSIAHNILFEISKQYILSGKFHTYRGVLSLLGTQYLALHKRCITWYKENGYWNQEQVDQYMCWLNEEIKEAG